MEVTTNLQMVAKPGKGGELVDFMKGILSDTRAFKGNHFYFLVSDMEDADKVEGIGHWDSKEAFDAYLEWRVNTGLLDELGPFLAAEPVIRMHQVEQR